MKAPDLFEPFLGWKGLLADKEGGLWSPQHGKVLWPVGKPLLAKCGNPRHKPPVRGCMCGIYAVKTFEDLRNDGYNWSGPTRSLAIDEYDSRGMVWVIAQVALYGEVRKGAIGWRASKAAPQKVYVPAHKIPLGGLIKKRYGVNLGIIDRFTGRRM